MDNKINRFYDDINQAWREIFHLRDRIARLEKLNKTQLVLNVFYTSLIIGLTINQVLIYDRFIR